MPLSLFCLAHFDIEPVTLRDHDQRLGIAVDDQMETAVAAELVKYLYGSLEGFRVREPAGIKLQNLHPPQCSFIFSTSSRAWGARRRSHMA